MRSINNHMFRAAAASTLAGAALLGLSGCGPQSNATTPVAAVPAATVQQAPAVQPAPAYAINNGAATQQPAGQPVPAPNYYAQNPAPAPAPQAYAPPAQPAPQTAPTPAPRAVNTALRGEVRGIEPIRERPQGSGAGAVVGGVLGAVVGNQFGGGSGRTAMTVVGGVGGAVAGNNVERNMNKKITGYRVSVRLDNGQTKTYEESRLDGLQIGDRVRIEGHRVVRV